MDIICDNWNSSVFLGIGGREQSEFSRLREKWKCAITWKALPLEHPLPCIDLYGYESFYMLVTCRWNSTVFIHCCWISKSKDNNYDSVESEFALCVKHAVCFSTVWDRWVLLVAWWAGAQGMKSFVSKALRRAFCEILACLGNMLLKILSFGVICM